MSGAGGIWPSASLALRSLLWTLLLPGLVAGYLPWRFFGLSQAKVSLSNPAHILGILCIVLGAVLLGVCIVEFSQGGRGTLSPVDPPLRLVVRRLYRYVRNPMYQRHDNRPGRGIADSYLGAERLLGDLVPERQPLCYRLRGAGAASAFRGVVRRIHETSRTVVSELALPQATAPRLMRHAERPEVTMDKVP